ncbi:hypothetical protein GALL_204640 [mine drainage metagenome]|uniref:Knr4/Smi1-like domain-containing protein n=1 Tax=mine drainage metagenome TaxID=410659 RepID=A0A1J5RN32_9ZZZZ
MKTFKSLLQELDTTLRNYNIVEYNKLQPPLPDKEIDKSLKDLGIIDENVKALFQWKNGEKEDSYCQMMECGGLLSLQEIKEDKESYLSDCYASSFIPIISEGEQKILFNNKSGSHYGKLYLYSVPCLYIDYPISYYDSLETMVTTIIEAYKKNAYAYNLESNWLDIDHEKFREIAKKNNKKSTYWKKHNPLAEEEWYEI